MFVEQTINPIKSRKTRIQSIRDRLTVMVHLFCRTGTQIPTWIWTPNLMATKNLFTFHRLGLRFQSGSRSPIIAKPIVEKQFSCSFKVQVLAVIYLNTQLKVHVDLVHIIFPQTEFSNTFHKYRSINIPVNSPIKLHIKCIPYKIHSSVT